MKQFVGFAAGGPQNGTQAHALSRELEFGRPAQGGATPFWDPPATKPQSSNHSNIGFPLRGNKRTKTTTITVEKCYPCVDPNVLPMS